MKNCLRATVFLLVLLQAQVSVGFFASHNFFDRMDDMMQDMRSSMEEMEQMWSGFGHGQFGHGNFGHIQNVQSSQFRAEDRADSVVISGTVKMNEKQMKRFQEGIVVDGNQLTVPIPHGSLVINAQGNYLSFGTTQSMQEETESEGVPERSESGRYKRSRESGCRDKWVRAHDSQPEEEGVECPEEQEDEQAHVPVKRVMRSASYASSSSAQSLLVHGGKPDLSRASIRLTAENELIVTVPKKSIKQIVPEVPGGVAAE